MSERIVAVVLAAKAPTACDPGKRTQDFVERLEFGNSPPFFFLFVYLIPRSSIVYCLFISLFAEWAWVLGCMWCGVRRGVLVVERGRKAAWCRGGPVAVDFAVSIAFGV